MMKKFICALLSVTLLVSGLFCGCGKDNETGSKNKISLLADAKFEHGFEVEKTGVGNDTGGSRTRLDYMGTALEGSYWTIAQHCCNKSLLLGTESKEGDWYVYTDHEEADEVSKTVRINPQTGSITLNALTSKDYLHPRQGSEGWIHLLIQTGFTGVRELDVMEKLNLKIGFTFNRMDLMMTREEYDVNLHTAQFQLYFVIGTRNTRDESQQMWFGVPFFDYRNTELTSYSGALDAGTNMYISSMGNEDIMDEVASVEKRFDIDVDLKPYLGNALKNAQEKGFLANSVIDDLYLVNMNLGWEIPGTFDVGVDIHYFDLIAEIKSEYADEII